VRAAAVLLAVALGLGCGSARRSEPLGNLPRKVSEEHLQGRHVFMQMCNQCHPNGDGGLAPPLNNKPAPASAIKLQVRKGLGRMPSFDEQTIPEPDLQALVSYMLALRSGG
jgi:mono/diheme cytochrome c family protein